MKIALIIFVLSAFAFGIELKVSSLNSRNAVKAIATEKKCIRFIANFTPFGLAITRNDVFIGDLDKVSENLRKAGIPETEVVEFEKLYRGLAKQRFADPLVQDTLRFLDDTETKDRLFVCILKGNCELHNNAYAYFNAYFLNFETLSAKTSELLNSPNYVQGTSGIKRKLNLVLAKYPHELPTELRPQIFFTNLLHETRHFLDVDLLSDWIIANRTLLSAGLKPDPLFTKYIRIFKYAPDEEEVISINNGFYVTFLESRGYAICSSIYKATYDADMFHELNESLKGLALEDATKASKKSQFLKDENITADTVLDVGNGWAKMMRETIQSAKEAEVKALKKAG